MDETAYIRLYEEDVRFIDNLTKEEKKTKSDILKNLIHESVKKLRLDKAIEAYQKGKATIRAAAEQAELDYFTFLDELVKRNLVGPSSERLKRTIAMIK